MPDNYYRILGVDCNASDSEIRSAYRNCVKKYHPDHYGRSNDRFLHIQEAYSVLTNPSRKEKYDASLRINDLSRRTFGSDPSHPPPASDRSFSHRHVHEERFTGLFADVTEQPVSRRCHESFVPGENLPEDFLRFPEIRSFFGDHFTIDRPGKRYPPFQELF